MPKPPRHFAPAGKMRRLRETISRLNPRQAAEIIALAKEVQQRQDALSVIESRTEGDHKCPHCWHSEHQRWGYTRTGVQRLRCKGCARTHSGLSASRLRGIHRHDLFLESVRDILSSRPRSCRKLAEAIGVSKNTIWRWRMITLDSLGAATATEEFSGIVEVDETYQRESRKGSREWVRYGNDPTRYPEPPRHQWYRYTGGGIKMRRGLSRWQLPILTVADRGGNHLAERIADRRSKTVESALAPLVAADAILCSDGAPGYKAFCQKRGIEHFTLGSAPGSRVMSAAFHIQNVNALHSRYKEFIRMFRGPASKYLPRYLRWFLLRGKIDERTAFAGI